MRSATHHKGKEHIGLYCRPDEARAFRIAAELDRRSLSDALRAAMRRYVDEVLEERGAAR